MGVISFGSEQAFLKTFVDFGASMRRARKGVLSTTDGYLARLLDADGPFMKKRGNHRRLFLSMNGSEPQARLAAVVNRDLRDSDGQQVGCISLFESITSYPAANDILELALTWLREEHGLRRVWTPIDFDMWNGFGLRTSGFGERLFPGEPCNPPHYPDFLFRFGFHTRQRWHVQSTLGSADLDAQSAEVELRCDDLMGRGYAHRAFQIGKAEDIKRLHALVTVCFSRLPGFTPLTLEEFDELLSGAVATDALRTVWFITNPDGRPVAFAGAWPGAGLSLSEWTDGSLDGASGLCYTSAVAPSVTADRTLLEQALLSLVSRSVRIRHPDTRLVLLSGRHTFAPPPASGVQPPVGRHEYALFEINL